MHTSANPVNARGQIVGGYIDAGGTGHGFLLDNGTFITIDVPGATDTGVVGINAGGQIVGALAFC
jgi:probable HAF family extracellular repeat protein